MSNPPHILGESLQQVPRANCTTCKFGSLSCAYVKFVTENLEGECCPDFVSDFNEACLEMVNLSKSSERGLKCLSYKKISFEKPGAVRGLIPIGDNVLSAVDESDNCPFCDAVPLSVHLTVGQLTLYTQYQREVVNGKHFRFVLSYSAYSVTISIELLHRLSNCN